MDLPPTVNNCGENSSDPDGEDSAAASSAASGSGFDSDLLATGRLLSEDDDIGAAEDKQRKTSRPDVDEDNSLCQDCPSALMSARLRSISAPHSLPFLSLADGEPASLVRKLSIKSTVSSMDLDADRESLDVQHFVAGEHPLNLLTRMKTLWCERRLCDVVLCVEGYRIPAHRIVLSAVSDYFCAMFAGDMVESRCGEVHIHDVDGRAVKQLVDFAYTSELNIHVYNVQNLLKAASILQLSDVVRACSEYMRGQLHPSNCLGIRMFSERYGCAELRASANEFMYEHFRTVIAHDEYLQLERSDVIDILSSDEINVHSESQVFEAAIRWLRHELPSRREYVSSLVRCVRLPLLTPQFLTDRVETEPLVRDEPACHPLLLQALKYHLLPERRLEVSSSAQTQPRRSTVGHLYAVGGIDQSRGAMTIEEYNYRLNRWRSIGEMRSRRLQCGVAVVGRFLFAVGGRDGLKTLNTVERFDTRTHLWSTVASMCTHRHGVSVAVMFGPMYAVGGHDGWSYLNTVERYDPTLNQWSFVAPMNAARSTAGVAVLNSRLYAVGGRDSISCLASAECYDPHTNRWSALASMSQKRGAVGVGVCSGKLFAVGGHEQATPFNNVECYDPLTDQWCYVASMHSCRDAVGVASFANKLFAVGGYNGMMYLNSVECFDPGSDTWSTVAGLCTGRAGAGVVTVTEPEESDGDSSL